MNRRQLALGSVLLATLVAVWWATGLEEEDATSENRPRKPAAKTTRSTTLKEGRSGVNQASILAQLARAHIARDALPDLQRDPFGIVSFEPPPPPPPKRVEQAPVAPPLRFKFMGKLMEGQRNAVFLDNGGTLLIAREGETLAGQYRVVSISERSMQFEYLPLKTTQTLSY